MPVTLDKTYFAADDGSLVGPSHPRRRILIGNAGDSIPDDIAAKYGLSTPPVAYGALATTLTNIWKKEDYGPLPFAGAPSNGTSEIATLTFGGTPTGGTFRLGYNGNFTAPIAWNATNATLVANIDAALEALPEIGVGNLTTAVGTMTAGIGTITVTFAGLLAAGAFPDITINNNSLIGTAPTLAAATTTAGVNATQRGVPKGALLIDTTNAQLYQNTGSDIVPTWTKVGVQA